jgi:hypothetical protein
MVRKIVSYDDKVMSEDRSKKMLKEPIPPGKFPGGLLMF